MPVVVSTAPGPMDGMELAFSNTQEMILPAIETPIIAWAFEKIGKWGPADIVLVSASDKGLDTHRQCLNLASTNGFAGLLSVGTSFRPSPRIQLEDSTEVLEILLHVVYNTQTELHAALDVLVETLSRLVHYGLDPQRFVVPGRFLYTQLLAAAVNNPMEVFYVASLYRLESLAVAASKFTFMVDPSSVKDSDLGVCESSYLFRLLRLHVRRMETFRHLLGTPPVPHVQVPECKSQVEVRGAWFNLASQFMWNPRPSHSGDCIQRAFVPLVRQFDCPFCKGMIIERVKAILDEWALVKDTI